ncbi:MAG: PHA/PHB synthase family protein [Hyphomicrobiales bacterium]
MTASSTPELRLPDPIRFSESLARVAERSQRLVTEFLARGPADANLGMSDPASVGSAFQAFTAQMLADPLTLARAQIGLWNEQMLLWQRAAQRLFGVADAAGEPVSDRRFRNPAWSENAIFDYIKQSYLVTAGSILSTVRQVEGLDDKTAHKVEFYTRQFVDAIAPSNFLASNPEVLQATLRTGGENLLHGLENLLGDLERGKGRLSIAMTDMTAFRPGENIVTTPGQVIYQNELMQLIQYEPATEKVRRTPLLIVPPWINKFYVLDLRPENSFIRWAVAQGHSVFVISWINPDERLSEKSFEDYMRQGPLEALDAIEAATGERGANMIGYCLGGTLLATTLAYLTAKGEERVRSATYFVSLVDFTEVGDMAVFIDEEQLKALEARMSERGYLQAHDMANSFNMLRANDLIWSFVVNNYLLGKEPVPFDLLYWNADATRMPAAMHSFYLRNMYHENRLSKPGGITLAGVPIDLRLITTPTFILSTREDHIAPWRSTYAATQIYGGPVKFVLAASGHIAGIISPPGSKYGHWQNSALPKEADEWFRNATAVQGSWWPIWDEWVSDFSGGEVKARKPGGRKLKPLEAAPGSYVRIRATE